MKKLLFLVCLAMLFKTAEAQYLENDSVSDLFSQDLINAKVDFSNIINPVDPSLLVSVEWLMTPQVSLSQEAGLVTGLRLAEETTHFKGVKVREELRYYMAAFGGDNRVYGSFNVSYRYLGVNDRYTLGYGCDEFENCDYYRSFNGTIKTDRYAAQMRLGLNSRLSDRLFMEIDFGFGMQQYDLRRSSALDEGRFMENNRFFEEGDFGRQPYLTMSGKLCYSVFIRTR